MPAQDIIHDAVKNALIKDGWTITADPFTIQYEDATLFADLAAERALTAEKADEKIIVEIKSFAGPSAMQDFEIALGQYQTYLPLLHLLGFEHKLYLAVSNRAYSAVFKRRSIQTLVEWYHLSIIVVDVTQEEISAWIN